MEPGVGRTVRRTVQPQPPFEDAQLWEGARACVMLTCRPGVMGPAIEDAEGLPKVIVPEEVVAGCPPVPPAPQEHDTAVE
jgi:hypothetical protein